MGNTIQGTFGLNISPLRAAANAAKGVMGGIKSHLIGLIKSPLTQIGGAIGTFFTYEVFKSGIEGVIEAGASMVKLRTETGEAVGSLSMLKDLATATDTDFTSLAGAVSRMQRNLFNAARGGGPVISTLNLLHLRIGDLVKLKPEEQFQRIGVAINALKSPMEKAAAAQMLFGKGGRELLPLFKEIGSVDFGKLTEKSRLLEKDSETFHKITVAFNQAKVNLQGVFLGMADKLGPALLSLAQYLGSVNLIGIGQQIGSFLAAAVTFGERFLRSIRHGIVELKAGFLGVVASFDSALGKVLQGIGQSLPGDQGIPLLKMADSLYAAADYAIKQRAELLAPPPPAPPAPPPAAPKWWETFTHSRLVTGGLVTGSLLPAAPYGMADLLGSYSGHLVDINGRPIKNYGNWGDTPIRPGSALFGADLYNAYNQTPLLSFAERQKFMDAAVARGEERAASATGAFHAIRSGDTARRKEVQREQLRQKEGVDKSNQLLDGILQEVKEFND